MTGLAHPFPTIANGRGRSLLLLALLLSLATSAWAREPLTMNVMTFDGKSGYVELPQNIFDTLSEGTIETWVKWTKFNKWSRVFDFGIENRAVVVQTEKDKNSLNYRIWEGKRRDHKIQARKMLRKGVWHHVAAVFGRSGMALYLDGQLIGTNAFEGGLDVAAGGNNTIGKSNWPKDKMFQGLMAEFRVWNRRLPAQEIARIKDRTLRGDEEGLIGYWRLDDAADGEVPSAMEGGYPARLSGKVGVVTIPAITRFLVPGELAKAAQVAYGEADAAFQAQDYARATARLDETIDLVRDFRDSRERRQESQRRWDLAEAEKAYSDGKGFSQSGDAIRAYRAYDRALQKVPDFQDAASLREQALADASYKIGLFVLSSSKVRESLTPPKEEMKTLGRLVTAFGSVGRKDLLDREEELVDHQNRIYRKLGEQMDQDCPPYLRMIARDEMRAMISSTGANASHAHPDQVLAACQQVGVPVVVIGELIQAYSKYDKDKKKLTVWTIRKVDDTDKDGKTRKREVGKKSYTTHRVKIETEMGCLLSYRILDTATGAVIEAGTIDAADSDKIDFINWDRYDGVAPSSLRVKKGDTFKRLSSDDRAAIDARSTYKTEEQMLRWAADKIGSDLAGELLDALWYHTPP